MIIFKYFILLDDIFLLLNNKILAIDLILIFLHR